MFPSSIRTRLTLWYLAVQTVTLVVCAVIVYGLLSRSRYERIEARLDVAIHVIAASLEHEIQEHAGDPGGEASFRGVLVTIHHLTFPDLSLAVARDGNIVAEKADSDGIRIPAAAFAKAESAPELRAGLRTQMLNWSGNGWRYAAMRIEIDRGHSYLFLGGMPEREAAQEALAIRNAFLWSLPFPLLLSAAGGWWLARKSFAKVNLMMDAVEGITASALNRRLPEPKSEDELARLARTFNHLLARLEGSFEQQRQFMADASHELRTPVSVAHTAAQVTLDATHRDESEYRDALEVIEAQMQRMSRIVHDMFLLSRVDSAAVPIERTKFYLDEVLDECLRAARVLANTRQTVIEADPWTESPCCGDESLLRQAVMILLDNAIRHSGDGARVHVALSKSTAGTPAQEFYDITVSDTGPGIPPEAQAQIFERFFRLDKARSRRAKHSGGAGLGLPIASWIAKAHGGMLKLVSSSDRGATFRLTFPVSGPCAG